MTLTGRAFKEITLHSVTLINKSDTPWPAVGARPLGASAATDVPGHGRISTLPLSAASPVGDLEYVLHALCPEFADKCVDGFRSPHWLKPAVGSSHADEIKYNAKFFQVHDIFFPGILLLISSLGTDFLEVELVQGGATSSRVLLLNLYGCAKADPLTAHGKQVLWGATKPTVYVVSPLHQITFFFSSPLRHGVSLAPTVPPRFFFLLPPIRIWFFIFCCIFPDVDWFGRKEKGSHVFGDFFIISGHISSISSSFSYHIICHMYVSDLCPALPSPVSSLSICPLPSILLLEDGMGKNATELRAVIFSSPSTDVAK